MKKPLLFFMAFLATGMSYAQSSQTDTSTLKPATRSFATELNFNPFNGEINLNNSLNQIKFRYFARPDLAIRLGFNVSTDNSLVDNQRPYGTDNYRFKDDKSSTTVGVNLGLEKHFKGTRRLSPYVGFDISFTSKSMKQELIEGESILDIKGGWYQTSYDNNGYPYRNVAAYGYKRYGAALVTGFDFYMARNFFFGYEFSLGFDKTDFDDLEETQKGNASSTQNNFRENSSSSFGPRLMNGIRLGYILR